MAGLAGWCCAVLGLKRDGPKEPRVTLMSRTVLPPHFIGYLKKTKDRESERKTSRRQKKLSSSDREAPVIPSRLVSKEATGNDRENWCLWDVELNRRCLFFYCGLAYEILTFVNHLVVSYLRKDIREQGGD
ncbi:hypothetical protein DY000_02020739 [Brassica cretica]|uniref:Uncharacterized protein n=1 Tax=Brassica cretica TaxID=69181 RepID=A0ABQ7EEJ1_BRACR|nr:hypothetical protein DY000_02020739 [Brassica cretica]